MVSPEFIGNLQFSGYTLKLLASSFGLPLAGLKIHWEELKAILQAGYPVIANIEERHFVVVTGMGPDTVTFVENGITRTKPASEFQARWFGTVLVDEKVLTDPKLSAIGSQLSAKVLTTQELLKVKGSGWFKKLFKKIKRFFQKVVNAIVKAIQKVTQFFTKIFSAVFGKAIGRTLGFLASMLVFGAITIFVAHTAQYLLNGDFKGLFKYWGQTAIQVAMFALNFIPGVGQALYAGLQFLFQAFFAVVKFLLGAALQFIGSALSGLGSVLGGFAQGLGGFVRGIGGFLSQTGSRLMSQAQASLKELFSSVRGAFSRVGESLKRSLGGYRPKAQPLPPHAGIEFSPFNLERIPAHPWITNHGLGFVARESSKIIQKSLLERITDYVQKFSLQFLQQKIDQKLEKTKMNSFVKSLLSSFTGAALGALTSAALGKVASGLGKVASYIGKGLATVGRAIATGAKYVYQGIKAVGSAIGRGLQFIGGKIGDAFNATKSFFSNISQKIFGIRQPPVNAQQLTRYSSSGGFALGDDFAKITFGPDAFKFEKIPTALAHGANGLPTELLQGNSRFILNPVSDTIFRGDLDAGDLAFVKPNSRFDALTQIERIGNLKDTLADLASQGLPGAVGGSREDIGRAGKIAYENLVKPQLEFARAMIKASPIVSVGPLGLGAVAGGRVLEGANQILIRGASSRPVQSYAESLLAPRRAHLSEAQTNRLVDFYLENKVVLDAIPPGESTGIRQLDALFEILDFVRQVFVDPLLESYVRARDRRS